MIYENVEKIVVNFETYFNGCSIETIIDTKTNKFYENDWRQKGYDEAKDTLLAKLNYLSGAYKEIEPILELNSIEFCNLSEFDKKYSFIIYEILTCANEINKVYDDIYKFAYKRNQNDKRLTLIYKSEKKFKKYISSKIKNKSYLDKIDKYIKENFKDFNEIKDFMNDKLKKDTMLLFNLTSGCFSDYIVLGIVDNEYEYHTDNKGQLSLF